MNCYPSSCSIDSLDDERERGRGVYVNGLIAFSEGSRPSNKRTVTSFISNIKKEKMEFKKFKLCSNATGFKPKHKANTTGTNAAKKKPSVKKSPVSTGNK